MTLSQQRISVKFEVSFVHQDCSLRSTTSDLEQSVWLSHDTRRIVRICNRDQARARRDLRKQVSSWELEVCTRRHRDHSRASCRRENLIHGKRWHNNECFIVGLQKS